MPRQSTLDFSARRTHCAVADDRAPDPAAATTLVAEMASRERALPIDATDAPSSSPSSQPSACSVSSSLPATLTMEPSFELQDSTDWIATSLPAFEPLEAALRCEVCKEFYTNPVITACSHTFCSLCIRRCIASDGKCPTCKTACQANKLLPNITVRDITAKFQEARPKALELARAQDKDESETSASGRKRKREEENVEEEEVAEERMTRSRRTRRSTRRDEATATDDEPIIIPESDDEKDEYVPDGLVKCPICSKPMKEEVVFNHIPICPGAQPDNGSRSTRARNNNVFPGAFPIALQNRRKDTAPPPSRLHGLQYSMLNEKSLRKKLQELGIPAWGGKPLMVKRHQEWINIYNANCDASETLRKSQPELLRELDEWERTQGGSAITRDSHIMRKDFDGQGHATTHKSQFDDLIANARERARAAAKARQEKAVEPEKVDSNATQPPTNMHDHTETPNLYDEAALSTVRRKVEEAERTDSALAALGKETQHMHMPGASTSNQQNIQDTQTTVAPSLRSEESVGFDRPDHNPFASPTRKVPMFKMPEEPVVDVESSTTLQ